MHKTVYIVDKVYVRMYIYLYTYTLMYSFHTHVIRPKRRKYSKAFFYLSNQTLLVLMKHEVLVFKVFGAGLHKLIHFNSWTLPLYFT